MDDSFISFFRPITLSDRLMWPGDNSTTARLWVVVPVGTINYSHQLPRFGTCIALIENGTPVLVGISLPPSNGKPR